MRALRFAGAVAVALAIAACAHDWDSATPLETPQAGYPCGTGGVVCAVQRSCCWQGSVCGGEPFVMGCPPGQCCEAGEGIVYGQPRASEAGPAPRMSPQTPQRR